ncbi:MAG: glycosyltransferase [Candidatus Berkelbacteria bacterium]|nr:glycosyltransferase [Candidatus Berkelbacteria bacterium]
MRPKRIAIIAEWLTSRGGAEAVVYELAKIYPKADIFTSVYIKENHPEIFSRKVTTSFLKNIPVINKKHQLALLLLPKAMKGLNLEGYDLIISSSSAFGKWVTKPKGAKHICYCHTPMRWVWEPNLDNRLARLPGGKSIISWLKKNDLKTNENVDLFLANSQNTSKKIDKFYNRKSTVVYPPVELEKFLNAYTKRKEDFYFTISRMIRYKRMDLAISACKKLGRQLVVAGIGPEYKRLKKIAGKQTKFVGHVDLQAKIDYYKKAKATIFCAEEDFGIVPVESLACQTPVIGYGKGGILEVVENQKSGILFEEQSVDCLCSAILEFEKMEFDKDNMRKSAERFDARKFRQRILEIVSSIN